MLRATAGVWSKTVFIADDVHGGMVAHCGHFLPEEQPVAVARELATFFKVADKFLVVVRIQSTTVRIQ
ncbi:MAG: hypothetical protein V7K40_01615 [Nostoc sp.]|uniref:hypothetical protein n=1 Tax=Nostoc sp. TaxID=1180 RepID=UPI002FF91D85